MTQLAALLGRRLDRVTCSWHRYREDAPTLQHLWLHFDGLGPVQFHPRDHHLMLSAEPPYQPYDMAEYGRVTLTEDPAGFPFTPFLGERVSAFRPVRQRTIDAEIGGELHFPSGAVRVLALADEIVCEAEPFPPHSDLATTAGPGLDENGYIAREGSLRRVRPPFEPVVDAARERIAAAFGPDRLHSAYLYGSIPRGTAAPGVSDLDLLLALHGEPTAEDRRTADAVLAGLDSSFAQIDGGGVLLFSTATLLSDLERYDLGWFLACLCTPLLGPDLAADLPGYRPTSTLARETNGDLALALPGWRERLATADTAGLAVLSRAVSRRLVRTGLTLVMDRWPGWTSDLETSAAVTGHHYPDRADQFALAARIARTPTTDRAALTTLVDGLAPWLAAEYEAVHGVKAPRPQPAPVRAAAPADLPLLQDIERAAGRPFRDVGMPEIADDEPFPLDELARYQRSGLAWVAVDAEDRPIAYLVAEPADGGLHVEQVSVHPDHGRRGIGRALLDHAAVHAAAQGLPALTLTTFTDVPWNAPYYRRCGFRPLDPADLGPDLRRIRAAEAAHGLDRWPRTTMRRATG